jgi:hypothetical protein
MKTILALLASAITATAISLIGATQPTGPSISAQPQSVSVLTNQPVTLSVTASAGVYVSSGVIYTNTTYRFWLDVDQVAQVATLAASTNGIKPTSGSYYLSITNSQMSTNLFNMLAVGPGDGNVGTVNETVDDIIYNNNPIGSNP